MTYLILYFLLLHIKMALQLESCNSGGCNHLQNFQINCRAISNLNKFLSSFVITSECSYMIYKMGYAATKPDKVNIGITKNFRDQNLVICNVIIINSFIMSHLLSLFFLK